MIADHRTDSRLQTSPGRVPKVEVVSILTRFILRIAKCEHRLWVDLEQKIRRRHLAAAIDLQETFWNQGIFWKVRGHRWQTGGCKSKPGANDVHGQHTDHDGDPQGAGDDVEAGVQGR